MAAQNAVAGEIEAVPSSAAGQIGGQNVEKKDTLQGLLVHATSRLTRGGLAHGHAQKTAGKPAEVIAKLQAGVSSVRAIANLARSRVQ